MALSLITYHTEKVAHLLRKGVVKLQGVGRLDGISTVLLGTQKRILAVQSDPWVFLKKMSVISHDFIGKYGNALSVLSW